jgi:2-polyprenyl-3-methyl-5-hydroxy-6-metoxy-1,4-benzoquinol methylase
VPLRLPRLRCRICRKIHFGIRTLGEVASTHHAPLTTARFELCECAHCDVVYLEPPPSQADLRALYEESDQFTDGHYTETARVEAMLEYYCGAVANLGLLPRSGESLLEVGAGLAWVARACKRLNPEVYTRAQDVTRECAAHCPWVDTYHVGKISEIAVGEHFQLISLTHVIEHLVDPMATLADLSKRLKPGGNIFLTAPFRPVNWPQTGGIEAWRSYSYLHVPAHVAYLSQRFFELCASRLGLDLVRWDPSHESGQAFEAVLHKRVQKAGA